MAIITRKENIRIEKKVEKRETKMEVVGRRHWLNDLTTNPGALISAGLILILMWPSHRAHAFTLS